MEARTIGIKGRSNGMRLEGIDQIDHEILALLQQDGRKSFSDIGAKVGLSRTAVKNRISAMEKAGIITGFQVKIKPQATPQTVTFVVNIETKPEHFEEVKQALAQADEALTVVQTTGKCHLLAVCLVANYSAIRDFLNRLYKAAPGILSISAHSVIDTVKGSLLPENIEIEVRANEECGTYQTAGGENS